MKGPNGRLQKVDRFVPDLYFWVKTIWMTNDPGTFLQHRTEKHDYFFLTFSRKWIVEILEAFPIGFNMKSSHFNELIIDV